MQLSTAPGRPLLIRVAGWGRIYFMVLILFLWVGTILGWVNWETLGASWGPPWGPICLPITSSPHSTPCIRE